MRSKGMFLLIDVLFAISILIYFMFVSQQYIGLSNQMYEDTYYKQLGFDVSVILEKSGSLDNALSTGDTYVLRSFLNTISSNVCAGIEIYSAADLTDSIMSVSKNNCIAESAEQSVFYRTFISEDSIYLSKIRLWHNI